MALRVWVGRSRQFRGYTLIVWPFDDGPDFTFRVLFPSGETVPGGSGVSFDGTQEDAFFLAEGACMAFIRSGGK